MRALGYHPVPRETADILPGLKTDLINAIPLPPNQAMLGQCYTVAKHMLDMKWTVLSGATIIRKDTWDKIAPDVQKQLRAAADVAGAKIRASDRKEDNESIAAMQKKLAKLKAQAGGKAGTAKKAAPKAPKKAAAAKKKAAPKKGASSEAKGTVLESVLDVISKSRSGANIADLKAKTNLESRQLSNALYKLSKKGQIKTISRGVYVKA
jgi:TRAP-type C4-dicarboxylate transport system substrate-binding protein